jgi:dTDP-4-dehydrorhamnose reductase
MVTGASGLLGLNLCLHLTDSHRVLGTLHSTILSKSPFKTMHLDLADNQALIAAVKKFKPDAIVNCAALANIDACEKQPEEARLINTVMPGSLAAVCWQNGVKLIHISTDAVFDGKKGEYDEEDLPNPLSVYAHTKLDAEQRVLSENPDAIVARVNFYGFSLSGKRSLVEFFLNNLAAGNPINGFVDVMFCPLYVTDLVDVLVAMAAKDLKGLYHVVAPAALSKYAFGVKIAEKFGFDKALIQPKSVLEGGLLAARSPRLDLKIGKLQKEKITPPGQSECLAHLYAHYLEKLPDKIKQLGA